MDKNKLDAARNEIDALDRELSRLLQIRMDLVSYIADYKKLNKIDILDKSREQTVLGNVLSVVTNQEYKDFITATFESIMTYSKDYQKKKLAKDKNLSKKYALIGEHLSHSLSSKIHKLFFEKANIDASYELMEVSPEDLPELLNRLNCEGFSGINVTIPYKTEIMRNIDVLTDEVLRIGAVNTIKIGERSVGYNTDYYGFGMALDYNGFKTKHKTCAVLGSGGASRAVVSYLEDHGASRIAIVTRDTDATSIKYPGLQSIDIKEFSAENFDLVVNTTPVGMSPKSGFSPITKAQLNGAGFVMDLIFNPKETLLLQFANEAGIPCANGLYMLVAQAVCAQEIWQGKVFGKVFVNDIFKEMKGL